ncbi:MAG: PAS domain-containing protein [Phyllobacteriaceae bacterium]|nr:PAS domain-containing protein [Phyllobacteriaceae bacterium]
MAFSPETLTTVALAATALLLATGFSAFAALRLRKRLRKSQRRVADLELLLNEAEASLLSEPQVLVIWRGGEDKPERLINNMRGTAQVPVQSNEILTLTGWLERDSSSSLGDALRALRESGRAFNIGIKTLKGELLEADGRAAGGLATLRIRPLVGDRRQMTELSFDASKLGKQVERLSAILDAAPFPAWIHGKDGVLLWANQSYVAAVDALTFEGAQKATSLAKSSAIDTSRADVAKKLLGRVHAVQQGNRRAYNIHEMQIDGGVAGFAIDVTALEKAEKELDRHIKAHTSTLDKLNTAIAIFGPDQRLRFFNQAYVKLWGLDPKWLEGQPLNGEILDRLRSNRLLPEQANYREWKTKQLSSFTTLDVREDYWYLPDGRSVMVICEQHPFGGVTYLYENMTKEYQLESRVNELFDTQRETLDNLAEAVALFGSDGRLRLANPSFHRLWQVGAKSTPHVDELTRVPGLEADARAVWSDIRYGITGLDGARKVVDGRFRHGDLFLSFRAVPLPDGHALLTFADVTDSVRAEQALRDRTEALEAADQLKTTFLSSVSYEIRTPLTSVAGFAEALDAGIAGALTAKQREYVLDIRRSAGDLTTIIDAIIDLSAIDAGAMELKLASIDVATLLENATTRVLPALERRNQTISIEVAANVPEIKGDGARLEQVLGHLLSNAIGFSTPGAQITMGARRAKDMVQIWVADTGRGMDSEFQGKAFDRFQSKPSAGSHRGPGLGLSLVKSFTELHGGKVSLVSKLDHGTTVVCSLPIDGPPRKAHARAA